MNAVELRASTSVDLTKASLVDRIRKEVMDTPHFCDRTRGLEVEYDYDSLDYFLCFYLDLVDECFREKGKN